MEKTSDVSADTKKRTRSTEKEYHANSKQQYRRIYVNDNTEPVDFRLFLSVIHPWYPVGEATKLVNRRTNVTTRYPTMQAEMEELFPYLRNDEQSSFREAKIWDVGSGEFGISNSLEAKYGYDVKNVDIDAATYPQIVADILNPSTYKKHPRPSVIFTR